ncbi:hypothetical protein SAMN05216571_11014 [Onishia taeanensis]|jgi:hypothetical protein|uniref:Pentapeptide MXKDX repeat protein n=1 Tax=Onishia taeanensis TaxID=284577 RepID=A0A1G7TFV6_9GAMM|nr:hypothetical protein [Halomonas taeanensis]SDG33440.1 hypothetical protein SAMN05216571_11014 [Halomonas taeanensis]
MKRIMATASALTLTMMMSGAALAEHHEDEMATHNGVDSANEVSDMTSESDAKLEDGQIVKDGGNDSANHLDEQDSDAMLKDGEVAPDSGVDSANED